ncbi:ATP-binding cassette domain-containing protein [Neptuniibacter caesariensis]|uniref:Probable ATP-binding protein YheS n=1 Tax=Neptuniibacter caesariensis TaxID=207954 RepID=A0A7U8C465_NEPCE|nr:ATP-binding cassette domain-containing protein [Neptuniibacter caesariensis]EAR61185.1 probable ATP-binding component of ABC transporter [Oceanospirillum sp. MED92] [Neptuniibacter caesariensis]
MIQFQQVSLQRGHNLLLEQADLTLHSGWKIGLVGANGAGKSSVFKLIMGELHCDNGDLDLPGGLRISHMAQEVPTSERTALDYVLDGDHQLRQIQQQISDAEAAHDMHRLGELHAELDSHNGYSAESRAAQLLAGLGFSHQDISRSVKEFSGGWRIRLNLAQALMCPSDLLLLDEPTNHLDLDATIWLEQWLRQYPGMLILISHDRDFLDNVVSHITHVEHKKLNLYKGGYSAFELQRADRLAQQQAAFEKQQQRIGEIEDFVRRFRAKATKAKQAQSRIKELERMEKIAPAHVDSPFSFHFRASDKMSSPLLTLYQADCGYTDKAILNKTSLTLVPGMRIGLLGPNGAGKSTLVKTLVGDLGLCSGDRHESENLQIGYFAQHQLEALDMAASPLLHIKRISPKASEQEIRDFLGSFGFFGDRALEPVENFSGGEKARVALSMIAWQKPNLLLMDEPTNHLDLEVRHALTLALQTFEGVLILVSHDRHLLRNTVDEFLLVANGEVSEFKGDLDDYQNWLLEQKREAQRAEAEAFAKPTEDKKSLSAAERKEQKRLAAERRNQLRPLKKKLEKLEAAMETFHEKLSEVEETLSDASIYEEANKEQLKAVLQQQAELKQQAEQTEEEWMEQQEALEALEAEL